MEVTGTVQARKKGEVNEVRMQERGERGRAGGWVDGRERGERVLI